MERTNRVLWSIFVALVAIGLILVFRSLFQIDIIRSAYHSLRASMLVRTGGPNGTWFPILLLFIFSGAAGGGLSTLSLTDIARIWKSQTALPFSLWKVRDICVSLLIGCAGGVGGAITAVFIMSIDGKFKFSTSDGFDDAKVLTYISTGLVSGFLGFRLIRGVAEEWWKQKINTMESSVEELKLQNQREAEQLAENTFLNAIIEGRAYLRDPVSREELENVIQQLEAGLQRHPDRRRAIIILANLYGRRKNAPRKAIEILNKGIEAVRAARPAAGKDIADMLYNVACYEVELSQQVGPPQSASLIDDALGHLRQSVQLSRANAQEAVQDPDFDPIKTDPRFVQLVTAAGAAMGPQPPPGVQQPAQPPAAGQQPAQPPAAGQQPAQPPAAGQQPAQPPVAGQQPAQPPAGPGPGGQPPPQG
jgi:hypothetical protein